jgi:hypothetical protein
MKKVCLVIFSSLFIVLSAKSQDFGYNTFDAAAEYKWASNSPDVGLQFAFNAKVHSSIIFSGAFKTAFKPIPNTHNNERGRGWGAGIGYRYYFSVLPKGLFLGTRGELWMMGMYRTANETASTTHVTIFQPNAELGYTGLINDIFFVTVYASAGKQMTISSPGDKFLYGNDFVPSFGISCGWRF